jgi:large subunit ribosomal protein L4
MVDVHCYSGANGSVTQTALDAAALGDKTRKRLVRQAFIHYAAAHRAGTHSTLTRAEVNFTTRKPWRQKGTGRARAGDFSSPIWRKGGVVFGPKPRSYVNGLNRKARREALRSALLLKLNDGEVAMVDQLAFATPSTKSASAVLKALSLGGQRVLVVLPDRDENVVKSFRNLQGVTIEIAANVNAEHLLLNRHVVLDKRAYDLLLGRLGHA